MKEHWKDNNGWLECDKNNRQSVYVFAISRQRDSNSKNGDNKRHHLCVKVSKCVMEWRVRWHMPNDFHSFVSCNLFDKQESSLKWKR